MFLNFVPHDKIIYYDSYLDLKLIFVRTYEKYEIRMRIYWRIFVKINKRSQN